MKKFVSTCAGLGLLAAGFAAPITPLAAQSENAAVVIDDSGCGGFVPTADGGIGALIFTPDGAHAVRTSSGNQILTCQFDIPEGSEPATATMASGFLCGTYFGLTTDTKMVASPGGKATLICKLNPSSS